MDEKGNVENCILFKDRLVGSGVETIEKNGRKFFTSSVVFKHIKKVIFDGEE